MMMHDAMMTPKRKRTSNSNIGDFSGSLQKSKYKRLHLPPLHDDVESMSRTTFFEVGGDDVGWPTNTTASCASTLKSDIIEAWKRRKKKNHWKEAWKRHKKRRQLKLDRLKPVPHRLKLAPPAIAGLNTGYSRSTRVSYVLALKPPMLSVGVLDTGVSRSTCSWAPSSAHLQPRGNQRPKLWRRPSRGGAS
jgi:hypothetical protein